MTFGERLRDARVKSGYSQADLTKRSGVPKTMLSRYENDHILPSISTLGRLAAALEIHSSALLGNGSAISFALTDGLRDRGIVLGSEEQAKQLADVVGDMVDVHDDRVGFLGEARAQQSG
jgi:transcriptional regulator with XRE-family HTH domain